MKTAVTHMKTNRAKGHGKNRIEKEKKMKRCYPIAGKKKEEEENGDLKRLAGIYS